MEKALCLNIELDIEKMTLSRILILKKIFHEYSGHIAVEMGFFKGTSRVGHLKIQTDWGVRYDGILENELRKLSFIRALQLSSLSS